MIVFEIKKQELIKDKLKRPIYNGCNDDFYKLWKSKHDDYVKNCFIENQIQKLYDQ
tara:strand:- start:397 stop:564 length:168 start_codon:yes stop_codon:yes gene_type:complete